ncbi:MAG: class I SAM-dependent methyltransferase [Ginsengibacter sp.]
MITNEFYSGFYNASIGSGRLLERFEKIINLPEDSSDNKQRCRRVTDFIKTRQPETYDQISLLDVGTGTGVFIYEMSKYLKLVSCVDPDKNSIAIVNSRVNVKNAWVGSIEDIPIINSFNIITYNKVLEHIKDPIAFLKKSKDYVSTNGILYVEVPFAEHLIELKLQDERAEFFIEHFTIFTAQSLKYLLSESGFTIIESKNIIEPSGKHTIYAFATL